MRMKARIFTIANILLAMIALQACKHPLAIEGEGDIVDANNSGHGCTLEQFQAQDTACTENEVSGDYFVNYKAEPRPGWRFVKWEGPCSPISDFQYCRLNIGEPGVVWWEETYPDVEIPPSTAVFAPIIGNTGFLVGPGSAVTGVTWETPTQQGVTGLDGSFQYQEGETVRFMVGNTVLGEVVGKQQVSPFDLAGSPIQKGIGITWALQDEEDPFHTVINLAIFLQSLDHDADAYNGIEIRPGVASLLPDTPIDLQSLSYDDDLGLGIKVSPGVCALYYCFGLDLRQPWETFQRDVLFRHVIGRANRKHRFSVNHGIANPATALDDLYRALNIDPQTLGLVLLRTEDEEGNASEETWQYDDAGHVIRHAGLYNGFETWQYNSDGDVIGHEEHSDTAGHHRVETWQYDAGENLVRHTKDYEGDSSNPDRYEINGYLYDSDGNPTRQSWAIIEGGRRDPNENMIILAYQYDTRGNLRRYSEEELDLDTGGTHPSNVERWNMDANGNVTRYEHNNEVDTFHYDANGNLIRHQGTDGVDTYDYDANGNVTRHLVDGEVVETWQYDDAGRLTQYDGDLCIRGCYHYNETWQYDQSGNLIRNQRGSMVETMQYDGKGRVTFRERANVEDGTVEVTEVWEYHSNGIVKIHQLEETSGYMDEEEKVWHSYVTSWRHQYDSNGNLTREEILSDGNEELNRINVWHYDTVGKLTRHETENGDGVIDGIETYIYEPTGWGHLLSGIETFGYDYPPPVKPGSNP
jgi:YD repeat-containing protein